MNKIGLVIAREYLTRVKKKSFIIMSIVGPLLIAATFVVPILLAIYGGETKKIVINDKSELFQESFKDSKIDVTFLSVPEDSLENLVENEDYDGYLIIPDFKIDNDVSVPLKSKSNLGVEIESSIENAMESTIEEIKLKRSGIAQETLDNLKAKVTINTYDINEDGDAKKTSSKGSSIIGYVSAFMLYMFIFIYGAQIMRGVIEEKTSKVMEVVISSVKPFEMMMGKVIGIAGVGLTQLLLWVVLSGGLISVINLFVGPAPVDPSAVADAAQSQEIQSALLSELGTTLDKLPMVIIAFLFYFLGGYLLYGSLFAAVGSAVDSDADSQQFMLPISIPLIISIMMLQPVLNDPHGPLAVWMSMIPFTSPVVMMMRVAFDAPIEQIILSIALLIGGFIFTIWVAGRIYRVGILMHGTKVNYKILAKWFMTKQ